MQKEFSKAGQDASKAFSQGFVTEAPKVEKALNRAADSQGKLNVETEKYNRLVSSGSADRVKLISQYERMTKAHRDNESAIRDASRAFSSLNQNVSSAGTTLTEMGATLGALGRVAAPVAIIALASGFTQLAGVASAASGAIGLLPGVIGGAASAFGTLKIATLGFGEALESINDPEKFAQALQALSPAAQQAALSIRNNLMPVFTQLKTATQDAFFAGVGPQLTQLTNQFAPTIQQATTGIAGAFNQAFMGVSAQLMAPGTQESIKQFVDNIVSAFQALAPAAAPLTKAFADLSAAGSTFLPDVARGASDAAVAFSQFIAEARQSGMLQQWMGTGLDILKQMLPIVRDVGEMFLRLAPVGERIMPDIVKGVDLIAKTLPPLIDLVSRVPTGFSAWLNVIDRLAPALKPMMSALTVILDAMALIGSKEDRAQAKLSSAQLKASLGFLPNGGGGGFFGGAAPGAPNIPVPMGSPGVGSGFMGGSGSMRPQPYTWGNPPPKDSAAASSTYFDPSMWQVSGTTTGPTTPVMTGAPAMGYNAFGQQTGPGGYVVDQNQVLSKQEALEEARLRLLELEADTNVKQSTLLAAKHNVAQAERELAEAQQGTWKEMENTVKGFSSSMDEIGAALDKDLGISKGLPGIAENLVKFIASLAAAPMLGQLNAMANAPGQAQGGHGLMGILGAQGAFGPQYTAAGQATAGGYGASAMGPAMLQPGFSSGQPYGLPGGTDTGGYGSSGAVFPPWVHQIEQIFGVKASTYSGHQEDNRNEAGYAPNPQGQNRGIDWSGPVDAMQRFADYLSTVPQSLEQVIWQNPNTGRATEIAGGQPQPGYFSGDLGGHQNHVHTRQSSAIPVPGGGMPQWSADWNAIAQAESSGNWGINTGNGYSGGLQFSPSSWAAAGGTQYAPNAYQASPYQQALTAEQLLAMQGPGAWPNTFVPGSSGPGWAGPGLPAGVNAGGGQSPVWGANPAGPGLGGSATAGIGPGASMGVGAAAGTRIGGVDPLQGTGAGGIGMAEGGSLDTAMGLAASAFPGLGQAAQTGMKLANRAIQYGGQVAGIMTQGALDTWLPMGGSKLAQNNWLTRIVGGLAGAVPALPNVAGQPTQPQQPPPGAPASGNGAGPAPGPVTNNVTVNNNRQNEDGTGKDVTRHLNAMYAPAGMP